ncbi:MAG: glycosyltransferase [Chloroflexota bacterium]
MRLDELTVVLPTRNEARNILAFLQSLPPQLFLIVVDAGQDATAELIETHRPERTVVLRQPSTVTEARQIGAEAARTAWLLFSDADIIFSRTYFDRLRRQSNCGAIYGPKLSRDEFVTYYRWFARGQGVSHRLGIPAASGSNLLVSRSAFYNTGGFDLRLTCNEDSELVWRIKRGGYPVVFDPHLVVYARDHRRLRYGPVRKTAHSVLRCLLLYYNLMPTRWRSHDWGYWSQSGQIDQPGATAPVKG